MTARGGGPSRTSHRHMVSLGVSNPFGSNPTGTIIAVSPRCDATALSRLRARRNKLAISSTIDLTFADVDHRIPTGGIYVPFQSAAQFHWRMRSSIRRSVTAEIVSFLRESISRVVDFSRVSIPREGRRRETRRERLDENITTTRTRRVRSRSPAEVLTRCTLGGRG